MDAMSQTPNPWQPAQPESDPWATRPRSELPFGDDPTAELPTADDPEATAIQEPVGEAPPAQTQGETPPVPVPPSPAQNPYAAYAPQQPQPQPPLNPYAPPVQQPYAAHSASAGYPTSATSAPYGAGQAGHPPQAAGYQPAAPYGQAPYGQPYPQPAAKQPGAFGALFDFSFSRTDVAPRLAKLVNLLAVVCFGVWWLLWSAGLFGSFEYTSGTSAFFRFAFGWLPALLGIGLVRLLTEGVLAVVRAAEHTGSIAEQTKPAASDTDAD